MAKKRLIDEDLPPEFTPVDTGFSYAKASLPVPASEIGGSPPPSQLGQYGQAQQPVAQPVTSTKKQKKGAPVPGQPVGFGTMLRNLPGGFSSPLAIKLMEHKLQELRDQRQNQHQRDMIELQERPALAREKIAAQTEIARLKREAEDAKNNAAYERKMEEMHALAERLKEQEKGKDKRLGQVLGDKAAGRNQDAEELEFTEEGRDYRAKMGIKGRMDLQDAINAAVNARFNVEQTNKNSQFNANLQSRAWENERDRQFKEFETASYPDGTPYTIEELMPHHQAELTLLHQEAAAIKRDIDATKRKQDILPDAKPALIEKRQRDYEEINRTINERMREYGAYSPAVQTKKRALKEAADAEKKKAQFFDDTSKIAGQLLSADKYGEKYAGDAKKLEADVMAIYNARTAAYDAMQPKPPEPISPYTPAQRAFMLNPHRGPKYGPNPDAVEDVPHLTPADTEDEPWSEDVPPEALTRPDAPIVARRLLPQSNPTSGYIPFHVNQAGPAPQTTRPPAVLAPKPQPIVAGQSKTVPARPVTSQLQPGGPQAQQPTALPKGSYYLPRTGKYYTLETLQRNADKVGATVPDLIRQYGLQEVK